MSDNPFIEQALGQAPTVMTHEATREEDGAYWLPGILDTHMTTIDGEGKYAFRQLQERIVQRVPDQTVLAWRRASLPVHRRRQPPSDRIARVCPVLTAINHKHANTESAYPPLRRAQDGAKDSPVPSPQTSA